MNINELLSRYINEIKKIYGETLQAVILFGSYARGDNTEDSDIDIMILANKTDMQLKQFQNQLADMTFDFNLDYDTDIEPIVKSNEVFNKWVEAYPFYSNIKKEGVILFEAV